MSMWTGNGSCYLAVIGLAHYISNSVQCVCCTITVSKLHAMITPIVLLQCGPGGCLMELCIQLAIIMVGKQIMNTFLEMLFP